MEKLYTVIVAGGKGMRMGGDLPKQFMMLGNKAVLMHTIDAFYAYDPTMTLIVVLPLSQQTYWGELCTRLNYTTPHTVVLGGETRYHSVKNALAAVVAPARVAVHDGVRPLVSLQLIDRCFAAAIQQSAVVPVLPINDSMRRITPSGSCSVARAQYRLVQTPQVFDAALLLSAYASPYDEAFTDDASVVEHAGGTIHCVEGERENIKITTPLDLIIAHRLVLP